MTHVDRDAFTVLSLCAGVGGLDLGVRLAVPQARTICYVEREGSCVETLASRMEDGTLDAAPVWADLTSFNGTAWRGVVDCVVGGYPCQPFSVAGRRRGARDPRHLWPHVRRIVGEVEPAWCFFENVGHHLRLGGRDVVTDLLALGYTVAVGLFTAEEVGASHKRERLFLVAHRRSESRRRGNGTSRRASQSGRQSNDTTVIDESTDMADAQNADGGREQSTTRERIGRSRSTKGVGQVEDPPRPRHRRTWDAERGRWRVRETGDELGHTDGTRLAQRREPEDRPGDIRDEGPPAWPPGPEDRRAWRRVLRVAPDLEPALRGMADGMVPRVDRLRACGNGVVPIVAAYAFLTLAADVLAVEAEERERGQQWATPRVNVLDGEATPMSCPSHGWDLPAQAKYAKLRAR